MSHPVVDDDFGAQVQKASRHFDAQYVIGRESFYWVDALRSLRERLKGSSFLLMIVLFLLVVSFGDTYAEVKLGHFFAQKIDEIWKPLTHI